jgi:hypothetical protein
LNCRKKPDEGLPEVDQWQHLVNERDRQGKLD